MDFELKASLNFLSFVFAVAYYSEAFVCINTGSY